MFLFLLAKDHNFVFHNSINSNAGRGFEIYIVMVYSEGIHEDLKKIDPKDYKININKLKSNNFGALEIFEVDINPWLSFQNINTYTKDNAISCMVFCIMQDYENKSSTRLIFGKNSLNEEVHINCTEYGIIVRK